MAGITFTIESVRLGLIKVFQAEKVEADVRLVGVTKEADMEFLAIVHTANITLDLLTALTKVNGNPTTPVMFFGGHINTSDSNTFYFQFKVDKDAIDNGGGLC